MAWVGRTASMVFGLALVMALVLGATSVALAGNLDPLKIGSIKNVATKTTQLVGKVATGSAFVVRNPSGGSALDLSVGDPLADPATKAVAPMKVDSQAKVGNLNADQLDGVDSAAFWRGETYTLTAYVMGTPNTETHTSRSCSSGDKLLSGGYFMTGSGFEVFGDLTDNNTYYLSWRSGAEATNASLYVRCADF